MKSICFIDHAFHLQTRSSDFFAELLAEHATVDRLYLEPGAPPSSADLDRALRADVAVLWQLDALAPLFAALGVPTVVAPMYDGSANMPDLHWLWAGRSRFVNFSGTLHGRVRALGCESLHARHFKPPVPVEERVRFTPPGLDAFFWMRRPEDGLDVAAVETLLGPRLRSLHVHVAPDDPSLDPTPHLRRTTSAFPMTVSRWTEDGSAYRTALAAADTFVAPRLSEGIGMAMLEAMARGMLIVAHELPTHDEYVADGVNGLLFDAKAPRELVVDDPERLGLLAWRTARDGHAAWLRSKADIAGFVLSTPRPDPVELSDPVAFGSALARAHAQGGAFHLDFLMRNLGAIEQACGRDLKGRVDERGRFAAPGPSPDARRRGFEASGASDPFPWLADLAIRPEAIKTHRLTGRLHMKDATAWVLGHVLELGFRIDVSVGAPMRLDLDLRLPGDGDGIVIVTLNDVTVAVLDGRSADGSVHLDLPLGAVRSGNVLRLQSTRTGGVDGLPEPAGFGLRAVRLG